MKVSDVLHRKGTGDVLTVPPEASVREVVALLAQHGIGALVVSPDGRRVVGIVSERDVVRHLHADEGHALERAVSEVMTTEVRTAGPEEAVDALARLMTERRVRHVPVLSDGVLIGLVSIGDVVKSHTEELETERDQLTAYITT